MEHEHHHHENHSQQQHVPKEAKATAGVMHDHSQHNELSEPSHEHMHDKHAGHHTEDFLKRFWICIVLTIPVLLLSEMLQHWFGFHIAFAGDKYILLVLGTIVYVY